MSFYSDIVQQLDLALQGKDPVALAQAALRLGFASAGQNIRESKCPNYRKTRGYPCSRTDGRPCGKCGG